MITIISSSKVYLILHLLQSKVPKSLTNKINWDIKPLKQQKE